MKKIVFTQEQINQMIKLHDDGVLNKDIAKYFGVSTSTINRRLAKSGIVSRHPRVTPERIKKAIELYKEYENINDVSKLLHMNSSTIHNILMNNNIPIKSMSEVKRTCYINESYFDNIDSHRKAYYLGLLYADGNVGLNDNKVYISLQEKDKDIIYQFREDLECNYKISVVPYNKRNPNWQNQYCITITNKRIHDSLILYGVHPHKSLTLKFPENLNEEYYCSFILGYLDGDGTISKKEQRIGLISTKDFCDKIAQIVKDLFGIHCSIMYCHHKTDVSTRCLQIAGRNQVKKFLDWVYSHMEICLQRKYEIYKNNYCM